MEWATLCQQVKLELEVSWQRAVGHQQRHPIGVKLRAVETLLIQLNESSEPRTVVERGTASDDPGIALLCHELLRRAQS